jgi:hypothetical protein
MDSSSLALIGEIDPFTESDKLDADEVSKEMEMTVDAIRTGEVKLATSYARLGSLLMKVKERRHWLTWGFESFGKYIDDLRGKIGRQRSQLYNIVSVAERLLPSISESNLEKIGITRANQLNYFAKHSGRNPAVVVWQSDTQEPKRTLLEVALDPTCSVEILHVAVLEELHQKGETLGTWFDIGGFYVEADERKEINQAIELAKRVEPMIDRALPDHFQRKEVVLRWVREFVGTYAGEGQ